MGEIAQFDPRLDDITVIIVTYNSRHCLAALTQPLASFAHVIISDNASDDGTAEQVSSSLRHVKLLVHERNLGFGAANNRALAQVDTPFALLLNPDCELQGDLALQLLRSASVFPKAAILAPQLVRGNGRKEISYRWPSTEWRSQGPQADAPCSVGFVSGAVLLLRMAQCHGVGFFDEDFFLYYEDEDLCLRLFKARRSIVVVPNVVWLHASRGSVRGKHPLRNEYGRGYHHAQSKVLFARKHRGDIIAKRLRRRTLLLALLSFPLRLFVPIPKHLARHWGRIVGLIYQT